MYVNFFIIIFVIVSLIFFEYNYFFMLYLIITALIWGFSFGLVKEYLMDLDSSFVAWARIVLALPLFLPFLRFKSLNFRLAMHLVLIGAIQYGLVYSCYIQVYQYLDSYQIVLFTIFIPIYVILFDNIYERKMNWINLGMALMAVLGAAIIKYEAEIPLKHVIWGFVLMQISNLCFSWGQIEYRRLRKIHVTINDRQVYALLFLGAFLLTTVMTTFQSGWNSLFRLTLVQIWVLIFLGGLSTGVGFFLWNIGAIKTHAGVLAVMNSLKIPLGILVSLTIFGEQTDLLRLIVGSSLMILAVFLSEYLRNRRSRQLS